jgi:hypothetical protein
MKQLLNMFYNFAAGIKKTVNQKPISIFRLKKCIFAIVPLIFELLNFEINTNIVEKKRRFRFFL